VALGVFDEIRRVLEASDRVLLVSHVYPEADSLGSQVALGLHLRDQGKRVVIANPTRALRHARFLEEMARREGIVLARGRAVLNGAEVIVFLDVSDWEHMGPLGGELQRSPATKVFMDHHAGGLTPRDGLALVDTEAAATGEIVYRYLEATGAQITPTMAKALYASLVFDTGCFRLRNARDETLLLAAELIRLGASHREVCQHLFESDSYLRLELLRIALGNLVTENEGRLAWTVITEDTFRRTGAQVFDADGILDQLVSIADLEVGLLFRELPGQGVKVTFRSKGQVDVSELARVLGGGGRPTAAGALLMLPLRESLDLVLERVRGLLKEKGLSR
jgi:phosphoesterase RecJ-like protein